jgi:hypothetical protein
MSRRIAALIAFALLSAGCVPVTEPVGDIDKAEPNKDLIGTWEDHERSAQLWVVDRPEVKGNPKGLMRVRIVEKGKRIEDAKPGDTMWFFTAAAGKHTYANMLLLAEGSGANPPDFARESVYAEWAKNDKRGYYVAHLALKGPVVTIDSGDHRAFEELMKKENVAKDREFYKTARGWLSTSLEKNGPEAIFKSDKGKNTLRRVEGKK